MAPFAGETLISIEYRCFHPASRPVDPGASPEKMMRRRGAYPPFRPGLLVNLESWMGPSHARRGQPESVHCLLSPRGETSDKQANKPTGVTVGSIQSCSLPRLDEV
ncbi:uncharacterized protein APUU_80596A [Aspergillus puulaauensis]|uniref:Uncharacterized protein n=1 Tax=Aspergillus puulaauensis TaxID=1220207 RepID=A0A7R8AUW4_9EURO|nr:uncharacterized protein APUU_80596A [Aspergillus puulaauensis]BCS30293.1 hypothetical protein APUU_80596A [Aspergillus puulaauensis]